MLFFDGIAHDREHKKTASAIPKRANVLGGPAKVRPLAGMSMKKLCDSK